MLSLTTSFCAESGRENGRGDAVDTCCLFFSQSVVLWVTLASRTRRFIIEALLAAPDVSAVVPLIQILNWISNMFDIIGVILMSLRAVREVTDWICKPLTLPDSLCQTLVLTKVPDQIVRRAESELNPPKTPGGKVSMSAALLSSPSLNMTFVINYSG